ncbi:NPCBM-associated, NEW3 domain of alpha-galactosidase [Candidatus Gugararchaeum adminiculabundum]|nr:NPCBM-associated, NEW3 domain of alpha-galactosidase [Candidatus Gugararchaeum adminiculabundum]
MKSTKQTRPKEKTESKKQNRFSLSFLAVFALLACLASVSFASLSPQVQLQNYSLSEVPAQPGHVVNLTLHFKSIEWDYCADNLAVQLVTSYPLSIQGPDTQYLGSLCLRDPDSKGTVSFLLPVEPLAQTGTYQVSVSTTYEHSFSKFSDSNILNLRVGGAPSFTASVVASNPIDIYPGDSAAVTILFQNNGSSTVESARVRLDAPEGIEVKWAGKEQELGQIPPRGSASATFSIEAAKSAWPGIYNLHATLDYASEDKTSSEQSFDFALPLKTKADFSVVVQNTTSLVVNSDNLVAITLKNTGTDTAKRLKVSIQPIFPFSTDGTVRYADSLAPGAEENLTFLIHVDKDGTPGQQLCGYIVNFEDSQGKKFSTSDDFALTVRTKTFGEMVLDYWYIAAVVGFILVIMILRRLMRLVRGFFARKKE